MEGSQDCGVLGLGRVPLQLPVPQVHSLWCPWALEALGAPFGPRLSSTPVSQGDGSAASWMTAPAVARILQGETCLPLSLTLVKMKSVIRDRWEGWGGVRGSPGLVQDPSSLSPRAVRQVLRPSLGVVLISSLPWDSGEMCPPVGSIVPVRGFPPLGRGRFFSPLAFHSLLGLSS